MNINEVNVENSMLVDKSESLNVLQKIYRNTGNSAISGYLGDSVNDFSIDDFGNLEFKSSKKTENKDIYSYGTVLENNVLIKQIQKSRDNNFYQLFSWNVSSNTYTYVVFDDMKSLDYAYQQLKKSGVNVEESDISLLFNELGISFDNVAQILLSQKADELSTMVDESFIKPNTDTSFTL
jgi:hypothetical protein